MQVNFSILFGRSSANGNIKKKKTWEEITKKVNDIGVKCKKNSTEWRQVNYINIIESSFF